MTAPASRVRAIIVTVIALALAAVTIPVVVIAVERRAERPSGCLAPNRTMNLYAEELPREGGRIRIGWGTSPSNASIPGPLIDLTEGDCIAITVTNDVSYATLAELWRDEHGSDPSPEDPIGISLHVHGVKYTTASDGTIDNDSWVAPGKTRTYVWYAAPRLTVGGRVVSLGTAGYWWYHDHVAGTDHGTGGLKSGLFGGVVVGRPGDLRPLRT
jgi:manganese oxidase